mmetsp:Transcript_12635/g.27260  ORF Transcript_12635/g.27260 Transcript_12635/m.27260 type:complete len:85 (-) Transcript_12635:190-444(-)
MFCTKVSKEPLTYGMAWRRMMRVSTEINETFLPKVKDLIENNVNSGKSHEEICELILQRMFVSYFCSKGGLLLHPVLTTRIIIC